MTVVAFLGLLIAFCFALPCESFASGDDAQLAQRHVRFTYGCTDCLGEVHPASDEGISYTVSAGSAYPVYYSTYMMACDTDHVLHLEGDGVAEGSAAFTSSNPNVLEIDSSGNVTLKKTGTVRITATVAADDVYDECTVYLDVKADRHEGWIAGPPHFVDRPVSWGLELDISDGPHQLALLLRPGAKARYTAENPSIVSVDADGVVAPLKAGTTQILMDIDDGGGRYKACRIGWTVKVSGEAQPGEDVRVPQEITGDLGPFTIDWHDGIALNLKAETDIEYSVYSSTTGSPSVNSNGVVTFNGKGSACIRAIAVMSEEYKPAEVFINITARDFAEEEAAAQQAAAEAAEQKAKEEAARKAAEEAAAKRAAEEAAAKKAAEEAAAKKAKEEAAAKKAKEEVAAKKAAALKAEIKKAKSLRRPALKVKAIGGGKIKITWSKVRNAGGYIVYVKYPGSRKYERATKRDATVKSVTHSGLSSNEVYCYRVRAYRKVKGKCYYGPLSKAKKARVR